MKLKLSHHLSLLAQRDGLQMMSLIPVDPTQQVTVITVPVEELVKVFAALGGRGTSDKKTDAARRNGRKGGRPRRI